MVTRRQMGCYLGGVALASGSNAVFGQAKRVFRAANPIGVVDAQQSFVTCGRHPKLNYYAIENVDLDFVNMNSITQAMVAVSTAQAEFASLNPLLYLPAVAKEPQLGIIAAYNWLPRQANCVVVKPDSPIKTIADLKGKRIGLRNQGDGGVVVMNTMFAELKLDPASLEFVAIGDGGVAGKALIDGRVDAMATFDTQAARIEAVGMPLRYLPLTPNYSRLSSGWWGFKKDVVERERKAVIGFCRAAAKSTLFAHTNLDQAINIHWQLYPESKSRSKSDDEARAEIAMILKDRKNNWIRRPDDPDQRWGASSTAEWQAYLQIASESSKNPQLAAQVGSLNNVFTNELVDEINNFDKAAVIRQAKEFQI